MTSAALEPLKSRSHGVSLGLFAGDPGNLRAVAREAATWGCDILHFDVMDGVFVPQMTGGAAFVAALDAGGLRDVHLMIENPALHVAAYVSAGADIITVHAEAQGAANAISVIRETANNQGRAVMVGLALMPGTPLEAAKDLLEMKPDLILVLALDPRRGTPPDIIAATNRLVALRSRYGDAGPVLAFDGGVTLKTIGEIAACKPDMIVSGSAVLKAENPKTAFDAMAKACAPRSKNTP